MSAASRLETAVGGKGGVLTTSLAIHSVGGAEFQLARSTPSYCGDNCVPVRLACPCTQHHLATSLGSIPAASSPRTRVAGGKWREPKRGAMSSASGTLTVQSPGLSMGMSTRSTCSTTASHSDDIDSTPRSRGQTSALTGCPCSQFQQAPVRLPMTASDTSARDSPSRSRASRMAAPMSTARCFAAVRTARFWCVAAASALYDVARKRAPSTPTSIPLWCFVCSQHHLAAASPSSSGTGSARRRSHNSRASSPTHPRMIDATRRQPSGSTSTRQTFDHGPGSLSSTVSAPWPWRRPSAQSTACL